ncbi:MAG TPA: M28 family peptidase [Pyrinomonadaceae bacterium]|nr:M28 family peptidase [Pyrinomonadaceae bacterium]
MRRLNLIGLALIMPFLTLPLPATTATRARGRAVAYAAPTTASAAARAAAERIKAEKIKEDLYVIASDEMAGRDTPSAGLDAAAKFIAERLRKLKLKPAGDDGSYFQNIELRRTEIDRQQTTAHLGERAFRVAEDFLPASSGGGAAEGQLVFAGHGWVVGSKGLNAYEGLDVRDKIVVVAGDGRTPPPGLTLKDISDAPAGSWETPVSYAQKHGAKGLVFVPRDFPRRWRYGAFAASRPAFYPARLADEEDEDAAGGGPAAEAPALPAIIPSASMLDTLFEGERADGARVLRAAVFGEAVPGFALAPSKRLRVALSLKVDRARTQNVVAVVEGRDPSLKREYVALGAHYDHVGTGRPVAGDSIYNGADDDGSGTVSLLAMAEAFARGPRPRRSILFVWHAGEEKGLWGSQYFTEFPTVPLGQIVAQLNIDMIGRSRRAGDTNPRNRMLTGPDEIYVIGSRMMSTELASMSESVNRSYLNLKFNYHYDDPHDPERFFYRSDHYNYARKGIPIIFYFDGVHEDYHQPSDHPDKIDYRKMEKVTRTVFVLAAELANADKRPAVDKQLRAALSGR